MTDQRVSLTGLLGRVGWSSVVEIFQLISSVFVFVIVAKLLTTSENGTIGAVMGIALPMANLTSFGSHILLIKRIAHGEEVPSAWRRATSVGVLGPAVASAVIIAAKPLLLPSVDWVLFALLLISQLNFFWLTELAVYIGTATRRLKEAAQVRLIVLVCRVAALAVFATATDGRLIDWAVASFVSFGIAALLAFGFVWRTFHAAPSLQHGTLADVREGAPFSVNAVTESVVNVSDRPLLTRFGPPGDDGIYFLGGRIIQFGYVPLRILLRASDADLFEAGKDGVGAALALTRRLLWPALAVGTAVGAGVFVLAPVVPLIVGDKYDPAVDVLRLLAVMPIIRSVQYLLGNCLSASDLQHWRLRATVSTAVLNVVLNVVLLVPGEGTWRTVVGTTLISEVFLTATIATIAIVSARREGHGDRPTPVDDLTRRDTTTGRP